MRRRALLSSLSVLGVTTLAGCSANSDDELPAGSLQFINRHDLPRHIALTVRDAGTDLASSGEYDEGKRVTGEGSVRPQRVGTTTSTSLDPEETKSFENIFTEPAWYDVEFAFDGSTENGRTAYHPSPPGRDGGRILSGVIGKSGAVTWQIAATQNTAAFSNRTTE